MDNRNDDGKRKRAKHDENNDKSIQKRSRRDRSRSKSPTESRSKDHKRKRRQSRSRSPNIPTKTKQRNDDEKDSKPSLPERPQRRAKETDMLNTRTGGAYIPPARLRMMQAQITDKSSIAYQRLAWEALKKSIHGHINKINVGNIGIIIKELLKENIVRGRGLLCRSVIQAQAASPTFTNVYAALVSAVNSRFPNIGELLLKRLVIQFKRGFKRNDKSICISSASFIAHLVNQRVAHEILALELLTLLVETPTDDSVEVSIAFLKECGQKLTEVSSKGVNAIFEMLRNILHEGQLDKRVQYMIEVMFQVWKDGFKDHPALIEELELVPEEEQFTHLLMLDDATDPQDILNVFKFDEKYEENEEKYKNLSKEILGSDAESGDEDGSGESGSEEDDDDDNDEEPKKEVTIIDNTETNLVALRRTIYLTINSSLDFEECAHKLMKMQLKPGQEVELCHMFLDCCAEQRTYEKFYGLLAQRFCNLNRMYIGPFEEIFKESYGTAHRLDTNRLRNVSKFFAHLLFTDSISWEVLECVKLNEEDTTSSSRIYIKILFQELAEYMGLKKLNDRLKDPTLQAAFSGVFPRDNPRNTRFSINFFTSIGLGGLTDELREHLKQMPKNIPPPITDINLGSDSSSDSSSSSSDSSSSSSSDSSSDSEGETNKKDKEKTKKKKKTDKPTEVTATEKDKDKDVERWGHDGFYSTYGDKAYNEPSARQGKNDDNNFAKPREKRGDANDKYDQRYNDDRRSNRNRSDDNSRRHPEEPRRERITEHRRRRSDDRDRDEDNKNYERYYGSDKDGRGRRERDEGYESRSKRDDDRSGYRDSKKDRYTEDNENSRRRDRERHETNDALKDKRSEKNPKNNAYDDRETRKDRDGKRIHESEKDKQSDRNTKDSADDRDARRRERENPRKETREKEVRGRDKTNEAERQSRTADKRGRADSDSEDERHNRKRETENLKKDSDRKKDKQVDYDDYQKRRSKKDKREKNRSRKERDDDDDSSSEDERQQGERNTKGVGRYWDSFEIPKGNDLTPEISKSRDRTRQRS